MPGAPNLVAPAQHEARWDLYLGQLLPDGSQYVDKPTK